LAATATIHLPFTHHGLLRAEWLCVLSWPGFAIGYRVRGLALLHIPRLQLRASSARAQDRALLWAYLIGFAARFAEFSRGHLFHSVSSTNGIGTVPVSSTSNQIIAVLALLPLISVAYLGLRAQSAPRLRRYYRPALLAEFIVAASSGGRGEVISVIIIALGVAYYSTQRFPLKATLVASLVGLFVVFPVLALYRGNSAASGFQVSNFSQGVNTYTSAGLGNALLSGVNTTLGRFSDITAPAALEDRGRQAYPLAFGGTLGADFLNFIPHVLAPGKPNVDQLENNVTYALRLTPVRNSYFAPTTVLEMYLDFGTIGTAIAFVVLGSVYREFNDWLALHGKNTAVCALYLGLAFSALGTPEAFIGDQLFGMLRSHVVYVFVIKVGTYVLTKSDATSSAGGYLGAPSRQ
jgi:hypothetical protein